MMYSVDSGTDIFQFSYIENMAILSWLDDMNPSSEIAKWLKILDNLANWRLNMVEGRRILFKYVALAAFGYQEDIYGTVEV